MGLLHYNVLVSVWTAVSFMVWGLGLLTDSVFTVKLLTDSACSSCIKHLKAFLKVSDYVIYIAFI